MGDDEQAPPFPHVPMPTALLFAPDLSDSAKMMWAVLYQFSLTEDGGGGVGSSFEITVDEMMRLTGAARASVLKRKKELVENDWLVEVGLRGLGRTNLYTIQVPGQGVPAAPQQ